MPTFGEWQPQGADYLQPLTILGDSGDTDPVDELPLFDYAHGNSETSTPFQDPRYQIRAADLNAAVQNAYGFESGFGFGSLWGTSYAWGYSLSIQDGVSLWRSGWGATVVKRRFRITDNRSYSFNPPNNGHVPPEGAIGIDYEGQPYDPASPWASGPAEIVKRAISSAAPTVLRGPWHEMKDNVLLENVPAAQTRVMFRPTGSGAAHVLAIIPSPDTPSEFGGAVEAQLPGDIDLTPYVSPGAWSGELWTETDPLFVTPVSDPGEISTGEVKYGWGFDDVRIDTTVRPPRWRWVFPAEETVTYRRVYPRDDGLAGGAPRTFPRSKAVQSSNRIAGGYL